MMNRINTFLFLTVLTATISVISMASAEAQARFSCQGPTYFDLSDPDSADGLLTIQGNVINGDEFEITSVRLDRATLRCRKSRIALTQEFPEEYVVRVFSKANRFVVQALGNAEGGQVIPILDSVDGMTAYSVSGTINPAPDAPDASLRATVTVTRSRVFFTALNDDANAKVELCTARLAVRAALCVMIE